MAERLDEIVTEIGALLSAITIANGFSFAFGTVNPPDRAKIKAYPAGSITIVSESPVPTAAGHHGIDTAQVEVELFCQQPLDTNPRHAMQAEYNKVISAVKRKFRKNLGRLPITGDAVLRYTGWRRESSVAGDVSSPYRVIVTCEVMYNANE